MHGVRCVADDRHRLVVRRFSEVAAVDLDGVKGERGRQDTS